MHNNIFSILLLLIIVISLSCASTTAPEGWLPKDIETPQSSNGAWISISMIDKSVYEGEFIAYQNDTIFILKSFHLIGLAKNDIKKAKLTTFEPNHSELATWTAGGAISTFSNGVLLVATFPMWIIGGTAATSSQSSLPIENYPRKSFTKLKMFARFPQGMPANIDRKSIK